MKQPDSVSKIEAEYLRGDISYADYRSDLQHYYRSVLQPEPGGTWQDPTGQPEHRFDRLEREMGR